MRSDIEAGRAYVRLYTKDQSKQGMQAWKAQLSSLATSAAGVAAAFGTAGAAAGFLVKLAADAETTATSFKVLIGNAGEAERVLADLRKFGAETPFEFPELADAGKKLLAFNVSTKELLPTLTRIGDISSGLQIPIGELAEIYGKARVQGRLFAEDVNQLTGRGIPVIQEFAKQFGVADSEVRKLVETGKIGFPELEKAFVALTSEGGKFHGMMAEQSKTLNGLLSTLKDNLTQAGTALGKLVMEGTDLKEVTTELGQVTANFQAAVDQAGPEVRESLEGIKASFTAIVAEITGATEQTEAFKEALVTAARTAEDIAKALEFIQKVNQYTGTSFMFDQWGNLRDQQEANEPKRRTPSKSVIPEPPAPVPLGGDPASLERTLAAIRGGDLNAYNNRTAAPTGPITPAEQALIDAMKANRAAPLLGFQLPGDGAEAFDNTEYGRRQREIARDMKKNRSAPVMGFDLPEEGEEAIDNTAFGREQREAKPTGRGSVSGTFSATEAAMMGSNSGPVERTAKAADQMVALLREQGKKTDELIRLERDGTMTFS